MSEVTGPCRILKWRDEIDSLRSDGYGLSNNK